MNRVNLKNCQLLLALALGFLVSTQNIWLNDIIQTHFTASAFTTITTVAADSQSSESDDSSSDSSSGSSNDDEASEPLEMMVAGYYSFGDDFESFDTPPAIGC